MKRNFYILLVFITIISIYISISDIQTVEEFYNNPTEISNDHKKVSLEINCSEILLNYDYLDEQLKNSNLIPDNGLILENTEYYLLEDDTVFTLLNRILKYKKIPLDYEGEENNIFNPIYVTGINNICEFSCGPSSGWRYLVNGDFPDCCCSDYKLKDGDNVIFYYVCEYKD